MVTGDEKCEEVWEGDQIFSPTPSSGAGEHGWVDGDAGAPHHISALHVHGGSSVVGGDQKCEEVWD